MFDGQSEGQAKPDDVEATTATGSRWQRAGHWVVYFCVRVAVCIVQAIPIEASDSFARGLAFIAHDLLRIRRRLVDENLRYAFPEATERERHRIALGMWQHVILMACELTIVPRKIHDTNWRDYIDIPLAEIQTLVAYLLSPRPTVLVSGHFGNFEVGGVISGLLGFPTFTVARPLDNPYVHRFVTRFREQTGQYMLAKRGTAVQIDAILQAGGTMVLLGDQSAGPKGCWIQFFGRPASCHKAVALFSLVNRAPMLLAYSRRTRPLHFRIGVAAVFDPQCDEMAGVKPLTQWYNDQLERVIRTAPDQYWWLHNRWKNKPHWNQGRSAKRRADAQHPTPGPASGIAATPPAPTDRSQPT